MAWWKFNKSKGGILNQKGFTILEMIAVIAIINLGMISLVSLSSQSIRMQNLNKNNLIAAQLAQEGIELIRNIRDNNWLNPPSSWNQNLGSGNYYIDYSMNAPVAVSDLNSSSTVLYVDGNGFYHHGSGIKTNFKRMITITNNSASSTIISRVRYNEGVEKKDYTAETVLYDWQ